MMESRKKNKTQGQSLVEMALTLPLLLLLVLGFIDLGRGIYYYSALGNAVREGARFATVQRNFTTGTQQETDTIEKVKYYSVAVPINVVTVDRVNDTGNTDPEGLYVMVKAIFNFKPVTPFIPDIDMTAESTMMLTPYGR